MRTLIASVLISSYSAMSQTIPTVRLEKRIDGTTENRIATFEPNTTYRVSAITYTGMTLIHGSGYAVAITDNKNVPAHRARTFPGGTFSNLPPLRVAKPTITLSRPLGRGVPSVNVSAQILSPPKGIYCIVEAFIDGTYHSGVLNQVIVMDGEKNSNLNVTVPIPNLADDQKPTVTVKYFAGGSEMRTAVAADGW